METLNHPDEIALIEIINRHGLRPSLNSLAKIIEMAAKENRPLPASGLREGPMVHPEILRALANNLRGLLRN